MIESIQQAATAFIQDEWGVEVAPETLVVQDTKKEFEGDFTLVVFPLTRFKLGAPPQIAEKLGAGLRDRLPQIADYNVIKGFLNLSLTDAAWIEYLAESSSDANYHRNSTGKGQKVVVEYPSPNTNKPLHLGHLRNIVLGSSLINILDANGYDVTPVCLFNDRGTNISKSMYAWMEAGLNDSPESTGKMGDKFVGDYYVAFAKKHKAEKDALIAGGMTDREAENATESMKAVHELTLKWENGDPEVRKLWETMNGWVYEAFDHTFKRLGISFDKFYYESQVYQRGKETVEEGLEKGLFVKEDDGSITVDLTDDKLDKKVLLRSNGTSLYITQDLAIAADKETDYGMDKSIYVVGNEQDYHFKVLFKILEKLEKPYAKGLFHLSYGMVDLPSGKMKSREGTTVEAEDLMDEMIQKALEETKEKGKIEGMTEEDMNELTRKLGLSALKYFLAKVDPKKRMLFDPKESIDIQGHTGPFIQYSYTRTAALARKREAVTELVAGVNLEDSLHENERLLLRRLFRYNEVLQEAADSNSPALMANYAYELARDFNRFYHGDKILQQEKPNTSAFRFALASFTGRLIRESMALLGIEMPERM
ncbi:arginine--tRNA ligase [Pontibacter sp. G13]|nr:arginine--tRNA ligase [Pontibacter sp. G13]WNJ20534.1 arginine--tRNA ligase [Pontibacter sp. G13]